MLRSLCAAKTDPSIASITLLLGMPRSYFAANMSHFGKDDALYIM